MTYVTLHLTCLASTVAWATLTPEELWKLIVDDTEKHFGFELNWYGLALFYYSLINKDLN